MALIDKLRFHNILTGAGLSEAPSIEFTEALQDTFDDQVSPLATKDDVERTVERAAERLERLILEVDARQSRAMLTWVAVIIAAVAIATGLIIALT